MSSTSVETMILIQTSNRKHQDQDQKQQMTHVLQHYKFTGLSFLFLVEASEGLDTGPSLPYSGVKQRAALDRLL